MDRQRHAEDRSDFAAARIALCAIHLGPGDDVDQTPRDEEQVSLLEGLGVELALFGALMIGEEQGQALK